MRFFTDHFFTEEQKVRILGNAYLKRQGEDTADGVGEPIGSFRGGTEKTSATA